MTFEQLMQQIHQQQFAPVYYLHGAATFFVDKIVQALDQPGVVLQASEVDFNRTVLYGAETQAAHILNACQSFPVMAQRRLVILKEAHRLNKQEWEKMLPYFKQPVPSTVLVLAFKDAKVSLPKAALTTLGKKGVNFHARRLYDRDVQQWISQHIQAQGFQAEASVPNILVSNLGTNLGLIENELEKMCIYLKATQQQKITANFVYQMINVDKRFNVFELAKALAERNGFQSHMIIDRLTQNAKLNPPVLTLNGLFRFFEQVALVHRFKLRDVNAIKNQLGVNYYQAKDYALASQKYSVAQTYRNLSYIRKADLTLKGLVPSHMDQAHVLKTLVWQLLN